MLNNAEAAQALLDAQADATARTEKKAFGPGTALALIDTIAIMGLGR